MGAIKGSRARCGAVLLSAVLAGSCSFDADAASLCDAAQSVRKANLAFYGLLGQRGTWEQQRVEVEVNLDDLYTALGHAADGADETLREDLLVWGYDVALLRDRAIKAESAEDLLYDTAHRPDADTLNPALGRIDEAFDEACGFEARR